MVFGRNGYYFQSRCRDCGSGAIVPTHPGEPLTRGNPIYNCGKCGEAVYASLTSLAGHAASIQARIDEVFETP